MAELKKIKEFNISKVQERIFNTNKRLVIVPRIRWWGKSYYYKLMDNFNKRIT